MSTPYVTDEMIAERVAEVERRLRALADELAELSRILSPPAEETER